MGDVVTAEVTKVGDLATFWFSGPFVFFRVEAGVGIGFWFVSLFFFFFGGGG